MKKNNKIKDINEYKKNKQNKHKKKIRSHVLKKCTGVFLAICVLLVVVLNICGNAVMSNLKYEIISLENDLKREEIKLEQIKANVDVNTSIQEIEIRAKEELNMDYPKDSQIRYISVEE